MAPVADLPIVRLRYDAAMAASAPPGNRLHDWIASHRPMAAGPMNTSPSRRRFLTGVTSAAVGIAVARPVAQTIGSGSTAVSAPGQKRGFHGVKPGEEREVEGTRLCWCPPGRFVMGSPPAERGRRPDEAQVEVTLSRGFWTGKWEVTQGQWKRLMGKVPGQAPVTPSSGRETISRSTGSTSMRPRRTVRSSVAAGIAQECCRQAWEFRLPTEAQWEYACRAGTSSATSFGDSLARQQANFAPEAVDRSVRPTGGARNAGSYPANPWGLHDMHGNVWEWCRDYYHPRLPGGDGSRSVRPEGDAQQGRHIFPGASRRRLDRARVGLPLGVPPSLRTAPPLRSHRLPGGRGRACNLKRVPPIAER